MPFAKVPAAPIATPSHARPQAFVFQLLSKRHRVHSASISQPLNVHPHPHAMLDGYASDSPQASHVGGRADFQLPWNLEW